MGRINWKLISNPVKGNQIGYLLDGLENKPLRAFSFQKLTATPYTNLCIEVFKANGQSLAVQYLDDFVNIPALLAFSGGQDVFISKWYCQLTGVPLSQINDSTRRFKIVSNGQLILDNGSLAMSSSGKWNPPCYMFCDIPFLNQNIGDPDITVSSVCSFLPSVDSNLCWVGADASANNYSLNIRTSEANNRRFLKASIMKGESLSFQTTSYVNLERDFTKKRSILVTKSKLKLGILVDGDNTLSSNDNSNTTPVLSLYNNLYLGSNLQTVQNSVEKVSEFLVWEGVLNSSDYQKVLESQAYRFKLNTDINLSDLSINVSSATGIADKLEAKEPLNFSWKDEHGIDYDTENIFYDARKIKLKCNMICNNIADYLQKSNKLNTILGNSNSLFLVADFSGYESDLESTPLIFKVISLGIVEHDKKWRNQKFVIEFDIDLIEPKPVKMVLKKQGAGSSKIVISTPEIIEISDMFGNTQILTGDLQEYLKPSLDTEYFILSGNIKNVSIDETTLDLVWKILN